MVVVLMNDIGIVTIISDNYGNRLQNYALSLIIEKMGLSVCTLFNIKRQPILRKLRLLMIKNNSERKRLSKFSEFNKKYIKNKIYYFGVDGKRNMNIIEWCEFKLIDLKFRKFIVGSDQVWNSYFTFNSDLMFLNFADYGKRIAYAASFGTDTIDERHVSLYKKCLSKIKHISVRENSGARIIDKLLNKDVDVNIDPTMLVNREEWLKVSIKPQCDIKKPYVLMYFLGDILNEYRQYIYQYAMINELDIIDLTEMEPNQFWYNTGPSEFIWLIEHSKIIFTDSFHGTVFSILMQKPFIVFERVMKSHSMVSRIESLLGLLDLKDRMFHNQSYNDIKKIDYFDTYKKLDVERKVAMEYLLNCLN